MKRLYGKHLNKYMGETRPELRNHETGQSGVFGPLTKTSFNKTVNVRSTTIEAKINPKEKSLEEQLAKLEKRMKNKRDTNSRQSDGIFK